MKREAAAEARRERWADLLERAKAEGFTDEVERYEAKHAYYQEVGAKAMLSFELVAVTIGYYRGLCGILGGVEKRVDSEPDLEGVRQVIKAEIERAAEQLELRKEARDKAEQEEANAQFGMGHMLTELVDTIQRRRERLLKVGGYQERADRLAQLNYDFVTETRLGLRSTKWTR